MNFTQEEMIASQMAMRNYAEDIQPIADSLTSEEAKKGYAMGLLVAIAGNLENQGEDTKSLFDFAIDMAKQAIDEINE